MDYIKNSVKEITCEYQTRDPFKLAKEMNIDIILFPFTRVKGMLLNYLNSCTIAINSNLPEHKQRAILAHELGHLTLSPPGVGYFFISENTLMESKIEREANLFMLELLIGEKEPVEGETLEEFALRNGIPEDILYLLNCR